MTKNFDSKSLRKSFYIDHEKKLTKHYDLFFIKWIKSVFKFLLKTKHIHKLEDLKRIENFLLFSFYSPPRSFYQGFYLSS